MALLTQVNTSAYADDAQLLSFASESAQWVGGGRYCQLAPETIEDFIIKADARMAYMARDDYEKILARLEFKNLLDVYSAKEPEIGCAAFAPKFERAYKALL